MNSNNQYKPVNWVNGMKINKSHFIAQQHAATFENALTAAAFLNEHNYGILPVSLSGTETRIYLNTDNQHHVSVKISRCLAITKGGYIIDIEDDGSDNINQMSVKIPGLSVPFSELKEKRDAYFIVLTVDPYNTVPFGAADPNEQPVRLPFTQPDHKISLLPEDEVGQTSIGTTQLPIGKVVVEGNSVKLVADYIPPSVSVNSHPLMIEHQAETEQFFGRMELNTLQILQKILQKNQQNELIEPVKTLSQNVLSYISSVYGTYRHTAHFQTPVYLISTVAGLARVMKNSIDIFTGTSKEEMINYFTEWCNIKQGELEDEITEVCNYKYDHFNIQAGIEKGSRFLSTMLQLFTNLAALDYIGKKKETGIFVKEQLIVPEQDMAAKRRGFFLAD